MKYVVTYTAIPTNYNRPTSVLVEAEDEKTARGVVRHSLLDLAQLPNYVYEARPYEGAPEGRILGPVPA